MDSDKKQSGWSSGWWLAIGLAALLILYPLSVGPVEWIAKQWEMPEWLASPVANYYIQPVFNVLAYLPESVRNAYDGYRAWWVLSRR